MGEDELLGNLLWSPGRFSVCVLTRACSQPRRVCNAADFVLCHADQKKINPHLRWGCSVGGSLTGIPHCPLQALRWAQSHGENPLFVVLVPLRIRRDVQSVLSFN